MPKVKKTSGTMVVTMEQEKETKGAVRYTGTGDDSNKNIYFRKEELKETFGEWPEQIKVTIEAS